MCVHPQCLVQHLVQRKQQNVGSVGVSGWTDGRLDGWIGEYIVVEEDTWNIQKLSLFLPILQKRDYTIGKLSSNR